MYTFIPGGQDSRCEGGQGEGKLNSGQGEGNLNINLPVSMLDCMDFSSVNWF